MLFSGLDGDSRVELVFRKTLLLWLYPYIFWYFGRVVYVFISDWVTEPADEVSSRIAEAPVGESSKERSRVRL